MRFPVEQILNLPGMKVLSCQEIDGLGLIIEIEAAVNYCTCPKCGRVSRSIHQNHWRIVQDLPGNTKQVLLRINRRQFKCNSCRKPFSEELDFVDKQRGYTKILAADITKTEAVCERRYLGAGAAGVGDRSQCRGAGRGQTSAKTSQKDGAIRVPSDHDLG